MAGRRWRSNSRTRDFDTFLGDSDHAGTTSFRLWGEAQRRRDGPLFGVPAGASRAASCTSWRARRLREPTPTEMALRKKILSALGMPPFLVGFADEANRASAEAALWAFDFSAVAAVGAADRRRHQPPARRRVPRAARAVRASGSGAIGSAESEIDERLLAAECVVSPNEVAREAQPTARERGASCRSGSMQDAAYNGDTEARARQTDEEE